VCLAATLAFLLATPSLRAQGAPVLNPAQVLGPNVTFTWSGVAGATGYVLRVGLAPGQYLLGANIGNTTSYQTTAPAIGTYYVRVDAIVNGAAVPSNEIPVVVQSMFVPPAAPANVGTFINSTSALITWDLVTGGGAPTALLLHAGTAPGASDVGVFPLAPSSTQLTVPNVPPGTYYVRMVAVNGGGASPVSNEAALVMPAGGGCSAPPARSFSPTIFGRYVRFNWTAVPGAGGYRLDFSASAGGPVSLSQALGAGATQFTVRSAPLGTFYGRLVTGFSCGSASAGPEVAFTVDGAPPQGPRAPDPAPGTRLSFPSWGGGIVSQLAAERPDLLAQSCREHGGNNRFLFEAVRRLRGRDNRFGLNWKRGNYGDMSQDIVNYNYSAESDEGTQRVYIIDIVGGHCGSNPTPNFQNQTQATIDAGTIGVWTLLPYLDAGYPIVSDPLPQ
jgi:hypothetical protein